MAEVHKISEMAYITFNVLFFFFFIFSADSLPLWQCSLPAVQMLPEWKQLHSHSADLCLLYAAGCGHRLHHAHARHGGASEEGDPGILSVSWQLKFCICFTGLQLKYSDHFCVVFLRHCRFQAFVKEERGRPSRESKVM